MCAVGRGIFFFFQAEDGIRDAQESRGLGDVYKRQLQSGFAVHLTLADKRHGLIAAAPEPGPQAHCARLSLIHI